MKCFLYESGDTDPVEYGSKAEAGRAFKRAAEELAGYGQQHEATLHFATRKDQFNEYPDFVLSLGPRGGLKIEKA